MYAIYAYTGVVLGVNVGIYGIHGVSGYRCQPPDVELCRELGGIRTWEGASTKHRALPPFHREEPLDCGSAGFGRDQRTTGEELIYRSGTSV